VNTISVERTSLDRVVSDLREHAASWIAVPLPERIALLERMLPKSAAGAAGMAAADSSARDALPRGLEARSRPRRSSALRIRTYLIAA
jgi:hypothetical protein